MRCLMCGNEIGEGKNLEELFYHDDVLCVSCRKNWKRNVKHFRLDGIPAESFWDYQGGFRDALLQFKECGDEALKPVFLYPDRNYLKRKFRGYTILCMPSTMEKMEQRGFSHLPEMLENSGLPILEPFLKCTQTEQKKKTRTERLAASHTIMLKPEIRLPEKLLLADDVLTTGSTLRGALRCLDRRHHTIRIFVFALVQKTSSQPIASDLPES
ncbi:MAG: ComF family protein [Bulleidia sp.]